MIYLKEHAAEKGEIIAMCDKELIGKVLSEGKVRLDLEKYASFYKGELVSEKDAAKMLSEVEIHSANIVGKRSVEVAAKIGLIGKADVRKVKNVPFVNIFKVDF